MAALLRSSLLVSQDHDKSTYNYTDSLIGGSHMHINLSLALFIHLVSLLLLLATSFLLVRGINRAPYSFLFFFVGGQDMLS